MKTAAAGPVIEMRRKHLIYTQRYRTFDASAGEPAVTNGDQAMTVCERISRERVALADLDDIDELHALDSRTKVRRFTWAMQRGARVPPVFVIRFRGVLTLIQGSEQAAAAERVGLDELDAVVFDASSIAESDDVGAVGFHLAEHGYDIWTGLQHAYREAA